MLPRPIHARALLSGAIISAAAANVITVQGGGIGNFTAGVGEVVGSSGSHTSYVIEGAPSTVVAGASVYYRTYVYPDGDVVSQGCTAVAPSSVECKTYKSNKDSGSTMVSTYMLTGLPDYVLTITGTNTGVRPETTVKTVTASPTSPASTAAEPTEASTASETASKPTDDTSTLTSQAAAETTSYGASAELALDKSWVWGVLATVLATF